MIQSAFPKLCVPLGEHSFVQIHHDGVLLSNGTVKHALHITVGTERFFNMTSAAILGSQLHGLKPMDILWEKGKSVSNGRVNIWGSPFFCFNLPELKNMNRMTADRL